MKNRGVLYNYYNWRIDRTTVNGAMAWQVNGLKGRWDDRSIILQVDLSTDWLNCTKIQFEISISSDLHLLISNINPQLSKYISIREIKYCWYVNLICVNFILSWPVDMPTRRHVKSWICQHVYKATCQPVDLLYRRPVLLLTIRPVNPSTYQSVNC